MPAMQITQATRSLIRSGMQKKKMKNVDLAKVIARDPSWVSKMLKGDPKIQTITAELADLINDALSIDINPIQFRAGKVSSSALKLSEIAETRPTMAQILDCLVEICDEPQQAHIPYVDQKPLEKIGADLSRIVHRSADNAQIGAECLTYLRECFAPAEEENQEPLAPRGGEKEEWTVPDVSGTLADSMRRGARLGIQEAARRHQ